MSTDNPDASIAELYGKLFTGSTLRLYAASKEHALHIRNALQVYKFRQEKQLKVLGIPCDATSLSMQYDADMQVLTLAFIEAGSKPGARFRILEEIPATPSSPTENNNE